MQDTKVAIEVLDHAIDKLGLMGVNLPGSVGPDPRIDAERLEPYYARVEELGIPMFLHPTDAVFQDMLSTTTAARCISRSAASSKSASRASRLIFSGLMERHPKLKIVLSHTGGALPYQAGRMDKNAKAARLPQPVTTYMKRMFTDTVSPHSAGMKFAMDYYGIDNVMYGTDYPCWDPATCLQAARRNQAVGRRQAEDVLFQRAPHSELRDPVTAKTAQRSTSDAGIAGGAQIYSRLRRRRADIGDAQHVGRARRAERNAGDDDDALAGLGESFAERNAAGAFDHVVLIVRVFGDHAMHAPGDRKPAAGRDIRRDRNDQRAWPFARHAQRGRSRRGPAHDGGKIDGLGDLARGGGDGVGAGVLGLGTRRLDDAAIGRIAFDLDARCGPSS